jgi:hypothetical protein
MCYGCVARLLSYTSTVTHKPLTLILLIPRCSPLMIVKLGQAEERRKAVTAQDLTNKVQVKELGVAVEQEEFRGQSKVSIRL